MLNPTILATALSYLTFITTPSHAAAISPRTFKFSGSSGANGSPITCPAANRTIYTAPSGSKFGILCNVDTNDPAYRWGPFYGVSFKDCICECDDRADCLLATYTGTCYGKRDAGGMGFDQGGGDKDWTAVKIGTNYAG